MSTDSPSRENIHEMFDTISPTYDRVNRVITLGMDQMWRRKFRKFMPTGKSRLLDLATGTGDQILALVDLVDEAIGLDLAEDMLRIGQEKCRQYGDKVKMVCGSALKVPFEDQCFDVITMSFGIRNVTNPEIAFQEMVRVLKPGSRALILEGAMVKNSWIKPFHLFYLRKILPRLGGLFSGHKSAYNYLNQTIETFPCGQTFCDLMLKNGFKQAECHNYTFGSVRLYVGYT